MAERRGPQIKNLKDNLKSVSKDIKQASVKAVQIQMRTVKEEIKEAAMGEGIHSKEYRMARASLNLTSDMLLSMNQKDKAIKAIQHINQNGSTIEMQEIHKELVNAKCSFSETFNLSKPGDFNKLIKGADLYTQNLGLGHISRMNSKEINEMFNSNVYKSLTTTQQETITKIAGLKKDMTAPKRGKPTDFQIVGKSVKQSKIGILVKNVSQMGDNETTRSIRKVQTTLQFVKPIMNASLLEGKVLYKGVRLGATGVYKGANFLSGGTLDKGVQIVGRGAANVANAAISTGKAGLALGKNVGTSVYKGIANAGTAQIQNFQLILVKRGNVRLANVVGKVPKMTENTVKFAGRASLSAVRGVGKAVVNIPNLYLNPGETFYSMGLNASLKGHKLAASSKRVVIKGAKFVGKTRPVKVVLNSRPVRVLKKPAKLLAKGAKFGFKGTKVITKVIMKPIYALNSLYQFVIKKLTAIAMKILAKICLPICIGAFGAVVAIAGFMAIIMSLTAIGDAVSDSLEEFKTETTMGATYEKLLEKEREFNEAILNLNNTLEVPQNEEFKEHKIKKYKNVITHYIGADGQEIYAASAGGSGSTSIITPNAVSDEIWSYLEGQGISDIHIAGLIGNFCQESSLRPDIIHTNYQLKGNLCSDVGLAQWTDYKNTKRYTGYMEYAKSKGKPYYDVKTQLDYLLYDEPGYKTVTEEYLNKNFASATEAAIWWCDNWEIPDESMANKPNRTANAENMLQHYSGNSNYTPGSYTITDSTVTTTTIKGILSMAAVYIDQDFKKYGAYTDGVFADSIYKDYCAKLYDSTHIIGIDETTPKIYYCPSGSAANGEPEYNVADGNCDNKIPGADSVEKMVNSGSGWTRSYSASLSKYEDTYTASWTTGEDENERDHDKDVTYTAYSLSNNKWENGPHGYTEFSKVQDSEDNVGNELEAKSALEARGCKNPIKVQLTKDSVEGSYYTTASNNTYGDYAYICGCDACRGHVDTDAYIFISNIYDPSIEIDTNNTADNEETETPETDENAEESFGEGDAEENSTSPEGKDYSDEGFDHVDAVDKEYKYSMYALDKYATAFNAPNKSGIVGTAVCPNIECIINMSGAGFTNVKETEDDKFVCLSCETEIPGFTKPKTGRIGDQESVNIAEGIQENRAAEDFIMEDITGKPMRIVDWWKNENWFTDTFSTTRTYFRLFTGEESFDSLEKPDKNAEDRNVVNKTNSTPYWFNSYTSPSGRNQEFEEHGWDNDSITRVRLLMSADWTELYGIQDFGFIQGSPMTDAQMAQLIANSPEWEELCDDRKSIISNALLFQREAQRLQITYHQSQPLIKTMAQLQNAKSVAQIADGTCYNRKGDGGHGFDCSTYVGFILYNSGLYGTSRPTTTSIRKEIGSVFEMINRTELLPGDIILTNGHVVLYMGAGKVSEAAGHGKLLMNTFNHQSGIINSPSAICLRLKSIDEDKFTIDLTVNPDKNSDESSQEEPNKETEQEQ